MAVTSKTIGIYGKHAALNGIVNVGDGLNVGAITKVIAHSTAADEYMDDITWGPIASGAVAKTDTPVISVVAGKVIDSITLSGYNTATTDYNSLITIDIDNETFTYAGTITITTCSLSVSSTLT